MNTRRHDGITFVVEAMLAFVCLGSASALAMGQISQVVAPGEKVPAETAVACHWPAGLLDLVNGRLRTTGWTSWFQWSEDDNNREFRFAFHATSDVAGLVSEFSCIEANRLAIRLAPGTGPTGVFAGFGEDPECPPGATLTVRDQHALDAWWQRLPEVEPGVRKFRRRRLREPPQAGPPTLTLYIDSPFVSLAELEIPAQVEVDAYQSPLNRWTWIEETASWTPVPAEVADFIAAHRAKRERVGNEAPGEVPTQHPASAAGVPR